MSRYFRIFGLSPTAPSLDRVRADLALSVPTPTLTVGPDEAGWLWADLALPGEYTLRLERFLVEEEGIRAELNSWAAYVEQCREGPHQAALMERIIQSRQIITLERPGDSSPSPGRDAFCVGLCRHLAGELDGVYQADDEGFYSADGTALAAEDI